MELAYTNEISYQPPTGEWVWAGNLGGWLQEGSQPFTSGYLALESDRMVYEGEVCALTKTVLIDIMEEIFGCSVTEAGEPFYYEAVSTDASWYEDSNLRMSEFN